MSDNDTRLADALYAKERLIEGICDLRTHIEQMRLGEEAARELLAEVDRVLGVGK